MAEKDSYEEYIEGIKNKDSKWSKISKQVKPFHVIGVLIVISILIYYWFIFN